MRPHPLAAALLLLSAPAAAQPSRSATAATTQRLSDTLPVLPDVYARRVAQFAAEPVVTGRVVFLGNSITQGGDWPRLLGDSTVVNRGIGGDVTFGVRARLDDVIRRRPSKLFLLIGVNDVSRDIPEAVIAANVRAIVEEVRAGSPETVVYVQSVLPLNSTVTGFPQHYDKGDHVVRLNRLLRGVAAASRARFVDLYPLFLDRQGRLDVRYTRDGLHLNEAGYQRWVAHLRATRSL
jgi:lysophospholipase L1-like esterase